MKPTSNDMFFLGTATGLIFAGDKFAIAGAVIAIIAIVKTIVQAFQDSAELDNPKHHSSQETVDDAYFAAAASNPVQEDQT